MIMAMKRIQNKILICGLFVAMLSIGFSMVSCSNDDLGESIFDTNDYPLSKNEYTFPLDSFCKANFQEPYNMRFLYQMQDISSDMDYNLVPCTYDQSVTLAVLCKYLWYDVYHDSIDNGLQFLKKYSPRIIHVIGSPAYNPASGTEVLGLDDRVGREARDEVERDLARRRQLLRERRDVLRVLRPRLALQVDDRLELVVVGRDVDVDHVLGRNALCDQRLQMVEHHVRIEDALLSDPGLGEAVAVVPRLDRADDRLGVSRLIGADALEVAVDPQDLLPGEAEHRVEVLVLRDVRGDVEPARQVVHRHRRDARHEDAVEARLERLEPAAVEARAVRDRLVRLAPGGPDQRIREVVVFVDDQIERQLGVLRRVGDGLVLGLAIQPVKRPGGELVRIPVDEIVEGRVHVVGELFLQRVSARPIDFGKV